HAEVQAISLDTPRFHQLEVDIGSDPQTALEAVLPGSESHDFFRVVLTGFGSVDLPRLQETFRRFPNLQLLDKTEPPVDLWENAGEDTLEGIYFEMLLNAMEEAPEQAEQIQLAAEISRKILMGKEIAL
ncbi:MAG: hypothetical protein J6V25_08030, partial [Oscillospiraceae bacterium]|nr:hypothetical protein [Oscillospiraceae bacterium]